MQHSTDVAGFNAAVRAAAKYGALNALATSIFSAPVGVRAARVPDLGVRGIAVSAHADNMDVVADGEELVVNAAREPKRRKKKAQAEI
jgi:hypothetical protein